MAAEVRKINISEDCKKIAVEFETAQPTTVIIQDSDDTTVELLPINFTYADGALTFEYTHSVPFNGVLQILPKDANEETLTPAYTIASCKINCCIGQLLYAAIECTCKCAKCKEDLLRAEKVYLFLNAAIFEAEHNANLQQALNNYNKASELCLEVCACGC
jgi:hypothetical protein